MQLNWIDQRELAGRPLFTSAVAFYDLPILIIGPSAETEKALMTALLQWHGLEFVTIIVQDWPNAPLSLKAH